MKILYFILFGLFSLNGIGQKVSLMSYNIGSSNWIGNRDSVIERIATNDPDVFCVIEATGNSRPFIENSFPNYNMIQTFGTTPNLAESHIFYRQNMFTIIDSGYALMDTYVGYTGIARYVNWARFEVTSTSNQFIVYASHFIYVPPSNPDSSTVAQYRHADSMIQLMNQHTALNIPMITVGDFNADSAKTVMQFLQHQTSVTYGATTINNPIALNDSWYTANPSTQKPGTVGSGSLAIDWILTTPNTMVTSAIIDNGGYNLATSSFPSDHMPLMIEFNLTTTSISESTAFFNQIYPNPTSSQLIIKSDFDIKNISISDLTGKMLKLITPISETIDVSYLPSGIYFIKLSGEQNTIIKKFIKQ